jgi:hypothetical protein
MLGPDSLIPGKDLRLDTKRITKYGGVTGREFVVELLPRSSFAIAPSLKANDLLLWVIPYEANHFNAPHFQYNGPGVTTRKCSAPPHPCIHLPPSTLWDTSPLQQVLVPNEEKTDAHAFVALLAQAMHIPEDTWIYVAKFFREQMEWRLLNSLNNKVKARKKQQTHKQLLPTAGQHPYKLVAGDLIAVIKVPPQLQPVGVQQGSWVPWADKIPHEKLELNMQLEVAPWLAREEDWRGQEQAKLHKRGHVKWADDDLTKRTQHHVHRYTSSRWLPYPNPNPNPNPNP